MPTKKRKHKSKQKSNNNTLTKLSMGIVTLMVVHALVIFNLSELISETSSFTFLTRLWGVNGITYLSAYSLVGIYCLLLWIILPPGYQFLAKKLQAAGRWITSHISTISFWWFIILFSFVSVFFFWTFRFKYVFFGDNYLRVDQVARGDFIFEDYGTMILLHNIYTILQSHFSVAAKDVIAGVNCIAGSFYLFFSGILARMLGRTTSERFLIGISLMVSGIVLGFFGYVEILPLSVALIQSWYCVLITLDYTKLKYIIILTLLLFGCLVFHIAAVPLLIGPVILIILYIRSHVQQPYSNALIYSILGILTIAGCLFYWKFLYRYQLPWFPADNFTNAIFSIPHFWQILQGFLFAAGGLGVLYVIIIIRHKGQYRTFADLQILFGGMALSTLIAIFVTDMVHGSADWDAITIFGPLWILGLWTFLRQVHYSSHAYQLWQYVTVIFVLFQSINLGANVYINHTDKSIVRLQNMITGDPGNYYIHHPASLQLSFIYLSNKLYENATKFSLKGMEETPDDLRNIYNSAHLLCVQGNYRETLNILIPLTKAHPDYIAPYSDLAVSYNNMGMLDKALESFETLWKLKEEDPDIYFKTYSNEAYISQLKRKTLLEFKFNKNDAARQTLRELLTVDPNATIVGLSVKDILEKNLTIGFD